MSMAIGLLGCIAGAFVVAASPNVVVFAVGLTMINLLKSLYDLGMAAWIADHVPYDKRGRVVGVTETSWALGLLLGVSVMGVITAFFLVGAALGGALFGWLGDRVGRVRAMALSILAYSLVTGLGYFAQSPMELAVIRGVSALGMGGQWALGVALVMESWPERWRPLLAGLMGAAANVGFLLVGVTARVHPVTPESLYLSHEVWVELAK
jgi:MFS family permease